MGLELLLFKKVHVCTLLGPKRLDAQLSDKHTSADACGLRSIRCFQDRGVG